MKGAFRIIHCFRDVTLIDICTPPAIAWKPPFVITRHQPEERAQSPGWIHSQSFEGLSRRCISTEQPRFITMSGKRDVQPDPARDIQTPPSPVNPRPDRIRMWCLPAPSVFGSDQQGYPALRSQQGCPALRSQQGCPALRSHPTKSGEMHRGGNKQARDTTHLKTTSSVSA